MHAVDLGLGRGPGFSRRYHQAGGLKNVWQTGYADHRCRDRDDFLQHKRYIEQNPVLAGLCQLPEEYLWSSASRVLQERHSLPAKAAPQAAA